MVDAKLIELGFGPLPQAPQPVGAYVPAVSSGNLLFISGQLPLRDGKLIATGKLGEGVTIEQGQKAAAQCIINALANVQAQLNGDWSRLVRVVRLGVFVQSADNFTDHAKVANGASELLAKLFSDSGRHIRAAVGTNSLPLNAAVEIETVFEIR